MFKILELRSMVLGYCDHYTVMAISRASTEGHRAAEEEMHRRIWLVVSLFISASRVGNFLALLDRTGAVIGGSAARRVMTINSIFIDDLDGKQTIRPAQYLD
jgi:hypothetical protein